MLAAEPVEASCNRAADGRSRATRRAFHFCTFPPQMRGDPHHGLRQAPCMDDFTDDDLFLDAVDTIVLDVLQRLGDGPGARFAFFQRLVALAQKVVGVRRPNVNGGHD